nr:TPA_asm: M [Heliosperma gammacytorhabdovirus 1]
MYNFNSVYPRLPANSGIKPVLSEQLDEFSHIYISFSGYIKVTGELEAGMEELYALTCAEAQNANWSQLKRDTIELIIWSISQNPEFELLRKTERSQFFGPNAVVKEMITNSQSIILTKRTSFSLNAERLNFIGSNKWNTSGMEWIIDIDVSGTVKRLSEFEELSASKNQLSQYAKSDKFSPYNFMSSCNINWGECSSSKLDSDEDK